jgi:predicted nuclease of predicted toxin-antitoxin system
MNLLADESIDRGIVERLRQDRHTVCYVAEMDPGISDDKVLSLANRQGYLLLTADKDFGELVFRQHRLQPGVVLIRLAGLPSRRKAEIVASAIGQHMSELPGNFAVITPSLFRLRRPSK